MPELPECVELGSIAGNKPYGLGRVLGLHGEHDGTVWSAKRIVRICAIMSFLPVSHSGMLFTVKRSNK